MLIYHIHFSNLTQFLLIAKNEDDVKLQYIEKLAKTFTQKSSQKLIAEGGLFSVRSDANFSYEIGVMNDIALENIGDHEPLNVFISENEIAQLRLSIFKV